MINHFEELMIKGIKAKWIRFRILLNILSVAMANGSNPVEGLRKAKAIREKRKKIHGLPGISRFVKTRQRYYWSENIPGWPSGALDAFFKGELQRGAIQPAERVPLQTIIFSITSRCNLRCRHCYEWENLHHTEHLQLDELIQILKKFQSAGLTHIQFSGGEPLERFDDLITLISMANQTMDCWVLTSGYGLTQERALQLRKAGLTGVNISLDHWDETLHNEFRNDPNSFHWVRQAAKNCREAGILVSLSLCATHSFTTRDNLYRYLELARQWEASFVRVLEPRKNKHFNGQESMLNADHISLLEDFFQRTNRDKAWRSHPLVMYPGFHQRKVGCFGGGDRYLYVDSRGNIHACPFCNHAVANALTDSVDAAIERLKQRSCHVFEKAMVLEETS